jgi:ubiquinone/menaquinone biosynthesis C-methylase UbiE
VLFPAARKVGPTGRVVGLDLSAAMVQETAADIGHSGWRHIEVKRGDAEHLDFPDASFDQVLCGFALWFSPTPSMRSASFFGFLNPEG